MTTIIITFADDTNQMDIFVYFFGYIPNRNNTCDNVSV